MCQNMPEIVVLWLFFLSFFDQLFIFSFGIAFGKCYAQGAIAVTNEPLGFHMSFYWATVLSAVLQLCYVITALSTVLNCKSFPQSLFSYTGQKLRNGIAGSAKLEAAAGTKVRV